MCPSLFVICTSLRCNTPGDRAGSLSVPASRKTGCRCLFRPRGCRGRCSRNGFDSNAVEPEVLWQGYLPGQPAGEPQAASAKQTQNRRGTGRAPVRWAQRDGCAPGSRNAVSRPALHPQQLRARTAGGHPSGCSDESSRVWNQLQSYSPYSRSPSRGPSSRISYEAGLCTRAAAQPCPDSPC